MGPMRSAAGSSLALFALVASVAIGAGCALSPAPVDHYYRLATGPLERRFDTPRLLGTLRVKRPRAEALTDGTNLIYRRVDDPAEVHRDAYQFWTDAPSLQVRDVLIDALHSAQLAERIVPPGLRSPADFTLSSRIVRMERLVELGVERATFDIEFSLVRERDRQLLFHERYRDEETVAGTSAAQAVRAYDRALARILEQLVADLDAKLPVESAGLRPWRR
jgi:ABC-type uncharacterized transport system auxiliary subunit